MVLCSSLGVKSSSNSRLSLSFAVSITTLVWVIWNNPHRCRFFRFSRRSSRSFMCFAPNIKIAANSPNSRQSLAIDKDSSIILSSLRCTWGIRETTSEASINVATLGGATEYVFVPMEISTACWSMVCATFASVVSIAVGLNWLREWDSNPRPLRPGVRSEQPSALSR